MKVDRIEMIPADASVIMVFADFSQSSFGDSKKFSDAIKSRRPGKDPLVAFLPEQASIETLSDEQLKVVGLVSQKRLDAVTGQRDRLLLALKAMRDEFRGHDLPYGSEAYSRAIELINEADLLADKAPKV